MGVYADFAPIYGEAGVRTFSVAIDENGKRPAVRGYLKAGDPQRRKWIESTVLSDCDALGIDLRRGGITVLDIDEPDEKLLADSMAAHGQSPFIVRTQGGGFQVYYANKGEPRDTSKTFWRGRQIDLLGGGFAVAAPSRGHWGAMKLSWATLRN